MMIRLGLIAIAFGLTSFIFPVADETAKNSDKSAKQTDVKSEDGKPAAKKKLTHQEQIVAMFKEHPFIDNPQGVLRKSEDFNKLKGLAARVVNSKDTERAFTGEFWNHKAEGTYICKKCNCPLYRSSSKFDSHCGWPSFDDEIAGTVTRIPDKDGLRTEIVCTNCGGHLGHVFLGEQFTQKNTRHCVNSVSINFVPEEEELPKMVVSEEAKKYHEKLKAKGELKKDDKSNAKPGSTK